MQTSSRKSNPNQSIQNQFGGHESQKYIGYETQRYGGYESHKTLKSERSEWGIGQPRGSARKTSAKKGLVRQTSRQRNIKLKTNTNVKTIEVYSNKKGRQ